MLIRNQILQCNNLIENFFGSQCRNCLVDNGFVHYTLVHFGILDLFVHLYILQIIFMFRRTRQYDRGLAIVCEACPAVLDEPFRSFWIGRFIPIAGFIRYLYAFLRYGCLGFSFSVFLQWVSPPIQFLRCRRGMP